MSPINNIEVGHHHNTRIMGQNMINIAIIYRPKNFKVNLMVLRILIICTTNRGKSSVMLQFT